MTVAQQGAPVGTIVIVDLDDPDIIPLLVNDYLVPIEPRAAVEATAEPLRPVEVPAENLTPEEAQGLLGFPVASEVVESPPA